MDEENMQSGRGDMKAAGGAAAAGGGAAGSTAKLDKPARQRTVASEAGRAAARVGAIASRPVTATTAAGRVGQIAARGGALAQQVGGSLRRAASTQQAQAAAFQAGTATRSVVNTIGRRAVADTVTTARAFGDLVQAGRRRLNARRGFGG
jgi:hypothetical protein